ncbi:MAG: LysR family transcriptional regulator [Clostridiales bacterium]|nr:LysR family transcriptional regulator [Clostridiales bacterium]
MKINEIRAFIVLAKYLNYTKAADKLYITQPTLSKIIKRMEDNIGVKLFVRTKRSVELTEIGKSLLCSFQQIIEIYDNLINEVEKYTSCKTGELKIGMLYYAIEEYISRPVKIFRKKYPNIKLSLFSYQPNPLINDLLNDKIDIGLIFDINFEKSDQLIFHKICKEKLIIATSPNHWIALRNCISIAELQDENIVLIDDVQKIFQSKFFKSYNNSKHRKIILAEHIDTLKFTLQETNGLTVVASHIRNMNRNNFALIDIKDDDDNCYIDMAFAYKKNNSNPIIPLFLAHIDNEFKNVKSICVNN